jgi:hypothetical protein
VAYQDVENIVLRGDPSHIWLNSIEEMDIVEYLGRKQPTQYHPDVIPLICRYPFADEDNITFVCQRFLQLLVYSESYLYCYKDRIDIFIFIAGFMESAGYTPAINQLVFHRNLLLKQGLANTSGEVLTLNFAITHLYQKKFKI